MYFVEKPFTVTVTEGEKLISIANQKGKILSVFQNRRWDGDFLTVKKIIKDKLLGRLVEFESSFHRYRNYIQDSWKEDPLFKTGTIFNLGSHMIDQALVLFGFPTSVWADIRKMRDGAKVDDYYNIHLGYKNIKVTLKGGYLVREPGPRYTLHGTLGSFLKHGLDPQEEALKIGEAIDSQDWGKEEEKYWGLLNTDINGVHVRKQIETIPGDYTVFYKNIYNTITKGEDLLVKPMEALNVIKIIEAAKYSSKIGEVVYFED